MARQRFPAEKKAEIIEAYKAGEVVYSQLRVVYGMNPDTIYILLYGMIRQLTFQMKRAETMEDFFHLKEAAAIFGAQAEKLFETWNIPGRYVVYGNPGDLDGIKELELLDYGEDDPDEDMEDAEAEEGVSFFEVMEGLIAKSKAVTADMEAALAELDSTFEPFRHNKSN